MIKAKPNTKKIQTVNQLLGLHKIRVIESPYMTEPGEPKQVKRTVKERFLSWPWKPWASTKTVQTVKPRKVVIKTPEGFIMHPAIAAELRQAIRDSKFADSLKSIRVVDGIGI